MKWHPLHISIWSERPEIRRFRRACWARRMQEVRAGGLKQLGPKTLQGGAKHAWKVQDHAGFAAYAEELQRRGLAAELTPQLARWRLISGDFARAAKLLWPGDAGARLSPESWADLACALAGGADWPKAAHAARRAAHAAPQDPAGQALLDGLQRIQALLGDPQMLSWADIREAVRHLLALAQPRLAGEGLMKALVTARLGPEAAVEAIQLATRIVEDGGAQAAPLIERIAEAAPDRDGAFLKRSLQEPAGQPPQAGADRRPELAAEMALLLAAVDGPARGVERLGELAGPNATGKVRRDLSLLVGRQLIEDLRPSFPNRPGPPKYFDLFPFNGEKLMLELKLAEMSPWVERFVIVEAASTFTGQRKTPTFPAMREAFRPWADKITYILLDAFPTWLTSAWAREFFQRDWAVRGLADCAADDFVLLTDVDEIVDQRALAGFDGDVADLQMETYRYFLNYRQVRSGKHLKRVSAVARARHLQDHGSSFVRRTLPALRKDTVIRQGGWHFTSVFPPSALRAKVQSYSHQEFAHLDASHFESVLARIRAGVPEPGWERVPLDDRLPAAVRAAGEELASLIL